MTKKLMFLAADDRAGRRVVMYTPGTIRPVPGGFSYLFEYGTGGGVSYSGCGLVTNERYSRMSPEEIELACAVEGPPTPEEIYAECVAGGMTPERARRHAGAA